MEYQRTMEDLVINQYRDYGYSLWIHRLMSDWYGLMAVDGGLIWIAPYRSLRRPPLMIAISTMANKATQRQQTTETERDFAKIC